MKRTIKSKQTKSIVSRRSFLSHSCLATLLMVTEAYGQSIFDILDPQGTNKDIQKAKKLITGTQNVLSSVNDIDYQTEFTIGESLALEGLNRFGLPMAGEEIQRYINLVGSAVARNSGRPDIPYYFTIINTPIHNAFACPGGIIFVSSALGGLIQDEAELASVLGHEIAHVSLRHALESIKRAKLFEGLGQISSVAMKDKDASKFKNIINGLQDVIFENGLDQNMEFAADMAAMDTAYRTGYDPGGLLRVLEALKKNQDRAEHRGSWFSTHPPLAARIQRCRLKLESYNDAHLMAKAEARFSQIKRAAGGR